MEGEAAAAAATTTTNDTQEAPEGISQEVQAEAVRMGWRPKEEWKGDPDAWRDADEFVKKGREFEPFVNARLKRENQALQKKIDRQKEDFDRRLGGMDRMYRIAMQQQREAIEERYAERKAAAVETGDREGFEKIVAAEKTALAKLDEKIKDKGEEEEPKKGGLTKSEREAFEDWQDDNTWFEVDKEMTALANRRFDRIKRDNPDMSFDEALVEVRKAVEDKFPEKFEKKAKGGPKVEGGSRLPGGGAPDRTASKLPAEARQTGERFVKEGLFKNIEEYAKQYFAG